jgi:hypothetical protein
MKAIVTILALLFVATQSSAFVSESGFLCESQQMARGYQLSIQVTKAIDNSLHYQIVQSMLSAHFRPIKGEIFEIIDDGCSTEYKGPELDLIVNNHSEAYATPSVYQATFSNENFNEGQLFELTCIALQN